MNSLKTDAMNQESIISRLQHLTRIYDFGAFFEETAALAAEQLQAEGAAFIVREGNNLRYLFFMACRPLMRS